MQATWSGTVLADSAETREAAGYRYFPRSSVRMELLQASPKTARDLECPHGVQFYDVTVNGVRNERAAWSYEAPKRALAPVDHWIGFWKDVVID